MNEMKDTRFSPEKFPRINRCPACGRRPKVVIDLDYEYSGFGGLVTIQCKPLFRKPHYKVEISSSDNVSALTTAIETWNKKTGCVYR